MVKDKAVNYFEVSFLLPSLRIPDFFQLKGNKFCPAVSQVTPLNNKPCPGSGPKMFMNSKFLRIGILTIVSLVRQYLEYCYLRRDKPRFTKSLSEHARGELLD